MACGQGVCPFWLVPEQLFFVRWMERGERFEREPANECSQVLTTSESARSSSSSSLVSLYTLSHWFGPLAKPHTCPSCDLTVQCFDPGRAQAKRSAICGWPFEHSPAGHAPRPQLWPTAAIRVCPGLSAIDVPPTAALATPTLCTNPTTSLLNHQQYQHHHQPHPPAYGVTRARVHQRLVARG